MPLGDITTIEELIAAIDEYCVTPRRPPLTGSELGIILNKLIDLLPGDSPGSANTILNGTIDPISSVGANGDFYLNTTSFVFFGPKSSGAWGSGTSIKGADGASGATGATGPGVPNGGTTGQVLAKTSNANQATGWVTPSGGGGSSLPVSVADTNSIPFSNMLTVVGDHILTADLVITPITAGAVAGCGAIQRIVSNGLSNVDISAFKKISTSGNYKQVAHVVNFFVFYFDGVDYNVSIFQNGTVVIPPAGDAVDAWATRLTAVGYTISSPRKTAYTTFIQTLKDNDIYDLITEMWMIEGGTLATTQIGFKNVSDGVIHGTLTYASDGVTSDAATGYMNLGKSLDDIGSADIHIAVYLQKNNSAGADAVGVRNSADTYISPRLGTSYFSLDGQNMLIQGGTTDTSGRYIMQRQATQKRVVLNGSALASGPVSGTVAADSAKICAWASLSGTTPGAFSDQKIGFVSLGKGLTDSQITIYDSALATLFTALGR